MISKMLAMMGKVERYHRMGIWSLVMKINAPSVELNKYRVITFNPRANSIFSTKLAMSSSQVYVAGLRVSYNMRKLVLWILVLLEQIHQVR